MSLIELPWTAKKDFFNFLGGLKYFARRFNRSFDKNGHTKKVTNFLLPGDAFSKKRGTAGS